MLQEGLKFTFFLVSISGSRIWNSNSLKDQARSCLIRSGALLKTSAYSQNQNWLKIPRNAHRKCQPHAETLETPQNSAPLAGDSLTPQLLVEGFESLSNGVSSSVLNYPKTEFSNRFDNVFFSPRSHDARLSVPEPEKSIGEASPIDESIGEKKVVQWIGSILIG